MQKIFYLPCVVLVFGPTSHGKSTVASELAYRTDNMLKFDLDQIKYSMYKNVPGQTGMNPAFFSEENTRRTNASYQKAADMAEWLYKENTPSVFSGTFSWESFKAPFVNAVAAGKIPKDKLWIFNLEVSSIDEIKRRIILRNNPGVDVEDKLRKYLWSKEQQSKAPWPSDLNVRNIDAMQSEFQVTDEVMKILEPLRAI